MVPYGNHCFHSGTDWGIDIGSLYLILRWFSKKNDTAIKFLALYVVLVAKISIFMLYEDTGMPSPLFQILK